jgi:ubiquitin C-terminal hydrolase
MNSALQCVLRIEPISKFFLRNEHLKDLNVGNVLGSEGYLACAYGELVKSYYTTGRRSLEPTAVLRVIQKNPQFRGYNHQDSQ